jgi:hypothetical protein
VKERYPFPFRAYPRYLVDEPYARRSAPLESGIEVVDGEADVVNSRAAPSDESPDGRLGRLRFEQLDEGFSGTQASDPRAVGIVERHRGEIEDVAVEWQDLVEQVHRDADVRDAGAATSGWHTHGVPGFCWFLEREELNPIRGRAKPGRWRLTECRMPLR